MTCPPRRAIARTALFLTALLAVAACGGTPDAQDTSQLGEPTATVVGTTTVRTTVTSPGTTQTLAGTTSTIVVTPTAPTLIPPPPTTPEPEPVAGDCPYLSNAEAADFNGQRAGQTSVIDVEPYPICVFTRQDGNFLAATRIVIAADAEEAAAAVNQHVPVDESDPVAKPAGWTGGAMGRLQGIDGYDDGASIYAVSKEEVAVIAISNQPQSIKARQMVTAIIDNLEL